MRNFSMKKFGTPIGAGPGRAREKVGLVGRRARRRARACGSRSCGLRVGLADARPATSAVVTLSLSLSLALGLAGRLLRRLLARRRRVGVVGAAALSAPGVRRACGAPGGAVAAARAAAGRRRRASTSWTSTIGVRDAGDAGSGRRGVPGGTSTVTVTVCRREGDHERALLRGRGARRPRRAGRCTPATSSPISSLRLFIRTCALLPDAVPRPEGRGSASRRVRRRIIRPTCNGEPLDRARCARNCGNAVRRGASLSTSTRREPSGRASDVTLDSSLRLRLARAAACGRGSAPRHEHSSDREDDGQRAARISRQGEDALGKLAQDLLENPLVNGAIAARVRGPREGRQAQEVAMGALNIPSAADLERLTRRLRSVSQRLEGIEDGVDRLDERLAGLRPRGRRSSTRLAAIEEPLAELAARGRRPARRAARRAGPCRASRSASSVDSRRRRKAREPQAESLRRRRAPPRPARPSACRRARLRVDALACRRPACR